MLKRPKPARLDRTRAEEIGLEALTFLVGDDTRLARFLGLTGIAPDDLVAGARTRQPAMLTAVLEHLAADESMLLVFASEAGLPPEQVAGAIALLEAEA